MSRVSLFILNTPFLTDKVPQRLDVKDQIKVPVNRYNSDEPVGPNRMGWARLDAENLQNEET
jgi:hypothetical protein